MTQEKPPQKSQFWLDVEAASKVVAEFPRWKRGDLGAPTVSVDGFAASEATETNERVESLPTSAPVALPR